MHKTLSKLRKNLISQRYNIPILRNYFHVGYLMRYAAFAMLLSMALAAPALANESRVFPPSGCGIGALSLISTTQTAPDIYTSTECLTPYQVLQEAWPCSGAQTLVKDPQSGAIICQDIPATPSIAALTSSCGQGEAVVGFNKGVPVCKAISGGGGLATCRLDRYQATATGWAGTSTYQFNVHVDKSGSMAPESANAFSMSFGGGPSTSIRLTAPPVVIESIQKDSGFLDLVSQPSPSMMRLPGVQPHVPGSDDTQDLSGLMFSCNNGNWIAQPWALPPPVVSIGP